MNEQDLRVIKTKKNIENSFIELLTENTFSNLTIQGLLDCALINRSTFYKYYHDKYDLAEQLIKKNLDEFTLLLNERFTTSTLLELSTSIDQLYQTLYKKRNVLLALWRIQTDDLHLYEDMHFQLKEHFSSFYTSKFTDAPEQLDYVSTLYASLIMSSIKWCLTHNYTAIKDFAASFVKYMYTTMEQI